MTPSRALAYPVVAVLAVLSASAAPAARAIAPPPIDHTLLPRPAPPAPPQPTVQRDICAAPSRTPDAGSPSTSRQLAGLDLTPVWRLSRGSGQRVAVIDTGVAPHPRLPQTAAGGDYVFTGDGLQDCDGHGTAVAGIIAAAADPAHRDGFGGVAPDVRLISIRQSSVKFAAAADPSGTGFGDVDTMARAVRAAADLGASVINISAVACVPVGTTLDDRALGAALAYAVDAKNAVVVAAAGNTGGPGNCPAQRPETSWDTATVAVSPAWYDDYVLTVGSVNPRGAPSSFTLAGPWVDVAAPGESAVSLSPSGDGTVDTLGGQPLSGTSYAAPVVSGLAALIRSRFPAMTARQVMQRIEATAHHPPGGWNPLVGNGLVDFLAAVSTDAPSDGGAATPTPPVAVHPPAASRPAGPTARRTAFTGAAICLAVAALVAAAGSVTARLRRTRAHPDPGGGQAVPGD
ncbi:type VII secretion-associated serine protease mycosin [Mycobacterium sp.]|uniref:type VII secretion-associated serine protease mycosin n=1 Tax=Mycobacterium sp. TaxID=1785 RepID=UPI0031DA95BB